MGKRKKAREAAIGAVGDYEAPPFQPFDQPTAPGLPGQDQFTRYQVQEKGPGVYQGAEQQAGSRLASLIQHGGYSPEQKQTIIGGAFAPVQAEAARQKEAAERSAYSRGLGQSGVLSRSQGDIDRSTLEQLQQISGQVEKQGADKVTEAIALTQSGIKQSAEANAMFEELRMTSNRDANELTLAIAQMKEMRYLSDADRAVEMTRIQNEFNLSASELEQMALIAEATLRVEDR